MSDDAAVSTETMVAIERAELAAWRDMYGAIPADYAARYAPELLDVGGVTLTRCLPIPFIHFNCALDVGVATPATERTLEGVHAAYAGAGIARYFVLHNPLAQPADLPRWLDARGLRPRGGWDRVWRPRESRAQLPATGPNVSFVEPSAADEWARFLSDVYGLPTAPWLAQLAGRPGWRHAVLRENGRIVAARSSFTHAGWTWLGVEAPVPGVMTAKYDADFTLVAALVHDALASGAECVVADIEAPHPSRATPAYAGWAVLGFDVAYHRTSYLFG